MQNKTSPITPELLTLAQVAALCGFGERTFWRYAHSGLAPAPIKIKGSSRYRRAEIMQWIAEGCPRCEGEQQQGGSNRE